MLTLFKYRRFNTKTDRERLQQLLFDKKIYCPTVSELDDPYDCNIDTAEPLMHRLVKFRVFCACGDKHDDILLFSLYADKHTGVSLEFKVEDGGTIGESTFLGFAERITYKARENFPRFNQDNIHQLLWTKYVAWKYQDEFRSIANIEENPHRFREFQKEELVSIRFGLKMDQIYQQKIMQWADEAGLTHVRFYKARLRNDCFMLTYDPLDFDNAEHGGSVDNQG